MEKLLKNIRKSLIELIDEKTIESAKRFFKENDYQKVKFLGVKADLVNRVAKEHFAAIKNKSKEEVFAICEELWKSNYFEESYIACEWIYRFRNKFKVKDLPLFETWIERYITNWATCDSFCNHTMGMFFEMFPSQITKLKSWAKSSNPWMRRAAAVSLIIPARKKLFHKEIFEIADVLLLDSKDLVQKGCGWMLKAASESDQDAVFQFVMKHKATMPRITLRYAIEKMPQHLKLEAMERNTVRASEGEKLEFSIKASRKPPKKNYTSVRYLPKQYASIDDYCCKKPGCVAEYKKEWDVTRYMINGKFFVLIMQNPKKESIITLKLEPNYGHLLRMNHKEVTPGYHMNKRHWNSISLESDISNDFLEELIDESYKILFASLSKKKQQEILAGK
ncbi:MAG: DNA alkylation repair protein [Thermoguttaceae bacterium]